MFEIKLEAYTSQKGTSNSFVVRGEGTRYFKSALQQLGGKFNAHLSGGAGYIFPNNVYTNVNQYLTQIKNKQVAATDLVNQTQIHNAKVEYYIYQPKMGQLAVFRKTGADDLIYKVIALEKLNNYNIIDNIQMEYVSDPTFKLHLQITNGTWQARGVVDQHVIVFDTSKDTVDNSQIEFNVILP